MAAAPLVTVVAGRSRSAWPANATTDKSLDSIRKNWKQLLARDAKVSVSTEPLRKSKAEWKRILSAAQFSVLREEDTERPFLSPLNDEKRPGVYVCAGCAL
ncbi:MAG: peptide-methionine (R)-S-oxide reductase, partial [Deltaproteobacteria bacterium]|nr:peptide-methionine (R)-S-oxide reductase [Deltaproteobacteria bacterium]